MENIENKESIENTDNDHSLSVIMINYLTLIYEDTDVSLEQKLNCFKKGYPQIKLYEYKLSLKLKCKVKFEHVYIMYQNLLKNKSSEIQFNKEKQKQKKQIHDEIIALRHVKELINIEKNELKKREKNIKKKKREIKLENLLKEILII